MTYEETEHYILDIPKFAGKHTLKDTGRLLRKLTEEVTESKIIHVAGTNGKGSVCAYLRSILLSSDRRVGMFISPHLETMRERICLDNEMISKQDFVRIFEQVLSAVKEDMEQGGSHPSFFEYLFLMAMSYYQEKKPDYIILETGLGGRLDATNSIANPTVCVITEIGYDHMQYLGSTLQEIAGEKAGIIKQGVPVVFVEKRPETTDIIKKYAVKMGSRQVIVGKDNILNKNIRNKSIDFSLHTGYYNYDSLLLETCALYQIENASLAVATAELLRLQDAGITEQAIRRGLQMTCWPGRMEEILPGVYLDGAHNADGVEALLSTARQDCCQGRRLLLFGVVSDKQYEHMISQIARSGLFAETAVTALESDRSVSIDELERIWRQYETDCSFHINAQEAYASILGKKKEKDVVYIAGSLYLIGQIKALMRRMPDD